MIKVQNFIEIKLFRKLNLNSEINIYEKGKNKNKIILIIN